MMKKLYISFFLIVVTTVKISAQDFSFSQFYEQPLLRNPALSGLFNGDIRVSMAYRDQWSSITVPFRTTSLSIEHKIPLKNEHDVLTIGTQMSMDGAGDIRLKRTQILPSLNFHKSLSGDKDTYLSLAFMGGPVSSQFDITQLKLGDQYTGGSFNPSNPTMQPIANNNYSYWDLSTGLAFSTVLNSQARFYIAAGLSHFTSPTIRSMTFTKENVLAAKLSLNMGLHGKVGERSHLIAFADYYSQAGMQQLLGGVLYGISAERFEDEEAPVFYFGSFLRYGDAVIPVVKMEFNQMSIGISYDVNVSKLRTASNWRGGLELTASYKGFLKIRNSTIDKLRCVRF